MSKKTLWKEGHWIVGRWFVFFVTLFLLLNAGVLDKFVFWQNFLIGGGLILGIIFFEMLIRQEINRRKKK